MKRKAPMIMKDRIARECGKLVMWYIPLILIGVFIGWLWAFLVLTALYLSTLVLLWMFIVKKPGSDNA